MFAEHYVLIELDYREGIEYLTGTSSITQMGDAKRFRVAGTGTEGEQVTPSQALPGGNRICNKDERN